LIRWLDINIALTTAGEALKIVNQLWGVQKAFNEAEWKLKVAELNGALATLKNAIVDAKEELKLKLVCPKVNSESLPVII
jgi:hypothetical protein